MTSPLFRIGAALAIAASAVFAVGCSGAPDAGSTSGAEETSPAPNATSPEPEPTEGAPAAPAGDPTCETIIPESTALDFESVGWSAQESPFYIGDVELEDGVQCIWADFDAPASDHLQLFGWAPVDAEAAVDAQAALQSQGWLREEAPEGVYITENPQTTIATDEDGYGMTYLFGDGWVKLADTKQGLILVEWPPS